MITPGVWQVTGGKIFVDTVWGWDEIAICGSNVEGSPTDNARLIAAAPDMLAALKGILEYWDTPEKIVADKEREERVATGGEMGYWEAVVERARLAVERATADDHQS